ncbi:hypothetical protein BU14_0113s0016 [Porphyra umbilicalis]|uniref:AAA+ ATPase domain-containing protein n=1 Tax=Porphyra umbilicalis TaxID=2786 RepID=A0A1X6PBN0_PORUM|nr:hypothetical protein BU14_0113s0016 [Porphyra umbilicalis]|eukprot:OSX78272.1 hypothetical protein BU14_0113s0016 [Porphyra umbilicalis]
MTVIGVISRASSVLFSAADEAAFARRLHFLGVDDAMVTRPFATSAAAMCWLTDPLTNDVVVNCCSTELLRPSLGSPPAGWLAVVTGGSRCCFDVGRGGMSAVLQLLSGTASSLTIVRKFNHIHDAHGWVNSVAASDLFEVLLAVFPAADDGGHVAPPGVPRLCAPPPVFRPRAPLGLTGACSVSSQTVHLATPGFAPPAGVVSVVPRGVPAQPSTDSEVVLLSPVLSVDKDTASSLSVADSDEVVDLTAHYIFDDLLLAASGCDTPDSRAPRAHGAAPSLLRGMRAPPATATTAPRQQSMTSKSGAAAAAPTTSRPAAPRVGSAAAHPGGVLPGLRMSRKRANVSDPASLAQKRYKAMINGGFLGGSAGTSASPMGSPPSTYSAPWVRGLGAAARRPAEASAAGLGGQPSDSVWSGQGSRRRAVSGGSSGRADPSTSSRALTGTASPAVVTSTAGPGSALMQAPMPEVSVEAPAVDGLSSRAELGKEAPKVRAGPLGLLARVDNWEEVFLRLHARNKSTFITGGPGVGKSTFLRRFSALLRLHWRAQEEVIVVGPTGSSAKTCEGQTYHSFFGFGHQYMPGHSNAAAEAAHLLQQKRWGPIARRLSLFRVLLLDEISMVPAATLDTMRELLLQCQPANAPQCVFYAFGDFLQLRPPYGGLAFTSSCWRELFGYKMLELTWVRRQTEQDYIAAIQDARFGLCSARFARLMHERCVSGAAYAEIETSVLHLVPRHKDVTAHNTKCLSRLAGSNRPADFLCEDSLEVDTDRDPSLRAPDLRRITAETRAAALMECVAPRRVQHCLHARVMFTSNCKMSLGLFHGSIGRIVAYLPNGYPVCRFENHFMPEGVSRGTDGLRDAGVGWTEVECAPVKFKSRVLSVTGALAVRLQVPFVLGWAITVHRSQSLTLSEAVLDLCEAFEDGMVHTAVSRVADKHRMYVKTFSPTRMLADVAAVRYYMECPRL